MRQKKLKKRKKNKKLRKSETTGINIFLLLLFLLLGNKFGKAKFIFLHLYYSFFAWQVIGNAVTKHQRPYRYALVSQTPYFDSEY